MGSYFCASPYDQDGRAEHYASGRWNTFHGRRTNQRELHRIESLIRCLPRGLTVVDVPCGAGRLGPVLRDHPRRLHLDLSWKMLGLANRREPGGVWVQGEARRLPVASGSVDLCLCVRLLQHLDREARREVLAELARVSRRYALVSMFLRPCLQDVRRRLRWALGARRGTRRAVGRTAFRAELEDTGWDILRQVPLRAWISEPWYFLLEKRGARALDG